MFIDVCVCVRWKDKSIVYLMDESCQHLLVAPASADKEAADWPTISVRLYRQVKAQQQASWKIKQPSHAREKSRVMSGKRAKSLIGCWLLCSYCLSTILSVMYFFTFVYVITTYVWG